MSKPTPPKSNAGRTITLIGGAILILGLAIGLSNGNKPKNKAQARAAALSIYDKQLFAAVKSYGEEAVDEVKAALQHEPNINAKDESDDTPLFASLRYGTNLPLVKLLLDKGADPNILCETGQNCLFATTDLQTVTLLVSRGAKITINSLGQTPLFNLVDLADHYESIRDQYLATAAFLISKGCPVTTADNEGQTALHVAAAANNVKAINLLLSKGAAINARDAKGYTPLKRANISSQNDAAAALKSKGGTE